jgi:D-3-phosphoglycerate dehydrogenase
MSADKRPLIVHADASPGSRLDEERQGVGDLDYELVATEASSEDELIANVRDADVVLVAMAQITRRVLENLPRCRAVVRYGIGLDNVDVEAATDERIVVAHVLDFCTEEVSNHAMALLLAAARRLLPLHRDIAAGRWRGKQVRGMAPVHGQTLGIVGFGNIGRAVGRKGLAFGLRVLAHDPYCDRTAPEEMGVKLAPLDELLAESDYVSLNTPLTPETRHMIGAAELKAMKRTAVLVNTARGPVVDEAALVEALSKGEIAAAALDVFEEEPLPTDSPLCRLENVMLSPHVGSVSPAAMRLLRQEVGRAAGDVLRGRWPKYLANPSVKPRVALEARNG